MAKIIETTSNRRNIKISTDEILTIIAQYQRVTKGLRHYSQVRTILNQNNFYLPEDL